MVFGGEKMDCSTKIQLTTAAGSSYNPDSVRIAAIESLAKSLAIQDDINIIICLQTIAGAHKNSESVRVAATKALGCR